MPKEIILASTSPRRKEILKKSGLQFRAVNTDYEEDMTLKIHPLSLAKKLSRGKAMSVVDKYKNHIIISADSFIALKDEVIGKPHNAVAAKKTLIRISGKILLGITGFTIIDTNKNIIKSKAVTTKVYIKKLTPKEIDSYVKTKEPLDKAGAFALQEKGSFMVKRIEGDFFNVMGLPLYSVLETLKTFGVKIL